MPAPPMTRLRATLLLLLASGIWGTTFVAQQWGGAHLGPFSFTAARFLLGALVVAPLAWREGRWLRRNAPLPPRLWAGLLATGGLLFGGAVLQQQGVMGTTVTNASFLTALYVPLVPLLAVLLFRSAPHPVVWPAGLACVAGTWLLGGAAQLAFVPGDLWVMASALFWAGHMLLVGAMAQRTGAPLLVACAQFLICALLSGGAALLWEAPTLEALRPALPTILYAGLLSVGVAFTLQVVAQRWTSAAATAIIVSSESVFATIAGALLLGERPTPLGLAGCALILAGALAVQLAPTPQRPKQTARTKSAKWLFF